MALSKKEFENKCIEVIESIILSNINYTRANAIVVSKKMLEKAKAKYPQGVVDIYDRVHQEFLMASDEEYNILKKQLFKDRDDNQ